MKMIRLFPLVLLLGLGSCQTGKKGQADVSMTDDSAFVWKTEQFADIKIIRYQIPGWDQLSLRQKKLVYYLTQAGLSGRDIIYDQNYRHNLAIRKALEGVIQKYQGNKNQAEWQQLVVYAKRVFVSNGIHHHYGSDKFKPEFSRAFFEKTLKETQVSLPTAALDAMFNNEDMKKVNLDPTKGLLEQSAIHFYGPDVTTAEAEKWFEAVIDESDERPVSYGLNSKLVKGQTGLKEMVWKSGGMYGPALDEMIKWLAKAADVAENKAQEKALRLLIAYYQTGDLRKWDEYNIAWCQATKGDIDYIHGFVETYQDPLGYKATYESIIQINDFEASARMKTLADNAQWFEDQSPLLPHHKKASVKGVSYKVVNVAGESGDASPTTPIGVNLPNANWIRQQYGSKSVSLGNIEEAYSKADGPGILMEFAHDEEEINRAKAYGELAGKLHTALHEVLGHASGKLNPGVQEPAKTLKQYASTLEEARADLFALYYIMDPKLIELGVIPSLEVGKAEYDSYIRNGLFLQLRRIVPGNHIEEAHMRNRQLIAKWVFEKGQQDKVIEQVVRNGKTYFHIRNYEALRSLFGDLLREIQRIKSEGDFVSGAALVENYGVKVNQALHEEVLRRSAPLQIPPYGAFINPKLVPVTHANGKITDIRVEYPADFLSQMLEYGQKYSFLQ